MKTFIIATIAVLGLSVGFASEKWDSGDKQLDRWLININHVAQGNWLEAIKEQAKTFNVPEERLIETFEMYEFSPADFYLALSIEKVTKTKWEDVVESFRVHRSSGVDKLREIYGLTANSPQFKEVRALIQKGAPEEDLAAEQENIFFKKETKNN
ncbi:hypothetical protein [Pleionea sediminis]|uniref:hypothetical protein n=1 Tax=Pleionea sediminis TaxID=2569479 RepID=UPI001186E55F|nr:hypothetical protein [Pleionea sediminis]